METVTGYVEHIVFRNEENGYTVFRLENDDGEVTCVGNFNFINEGEMLELTGEYVNHNVYGTQLKVSSHTVKEPEDLISIERYLGSGAIKGVGAALAGRIVKKFKKDTFRIIEEEPERLAEIKGISERKAREIAIQVEEKRDMRSAMIYLQKYGISTKLAAKIYQYYGMRVYKVLEENPYQLADNIEGVGFRTADEIAARIGIHTDSDYRIRRRTFLYPAAGAREKAISTFRKKSLPARRRPARRRDPGCGKVYYGSVHGEEDGPEGRERGETDLCRALLLSGIKYGEDAPRPEYRTATMPEEVMEQRLRAVEEDAKIELDPCSTGP